MRGLHEGPQQDGKQLPVAARPAVDPRCGHFGPKRCVFYQGDVGHCAAARESAFQQIVAEHLTLGQMPGQYGRHRLHVEQPFARKTGLAKKVLIDLRAGRAVRVDSWLACKQAVVQRVLFRHGQRRDEARLQNAIARHDAAAIGTQHRSVGGVGGNSNQFAQAPGGQLGIAVQRHDVARAGSTTRQGGEIFKSRRWPLGVARAFHEFGHQLLKLAALSLPTDPARFARAVAALAVQEQESLQSGTRSSVLRIERFHLGAGMLQQGQVVIRPRRIGIEPVGQQGKLGVRFRIGQVVQQQPVGERINRGAVAQDGRHHHHHAVFRRNSGQQSKPRQHLWAGRLADEPVQQCDDRLGGRRRQEQQREPWQV